MASLRYTVILEPGEHGGYHAFCPALRGCHSYGETSEEALANIREAAELYLEDMRARGETPPVEDIAVEAIEVAA